MRKITLLIIAVIALAGIFVRVQPRGTASAFRNANRLVVRTSVFYLRPLTGIRCRVPTVADQLSFDATLAGVSASNDEFPIRARFAYQPPVSLPGNWPPGDWCTSLQSRVSEIARRSSSQITAADLLADRRSAGDRIAVTIEQDLRQADVRVIAVSARIDLPVGFDRLRSVPEIAARAEKRRPVIFLGLDGADWELLDGYMASGLMPRLKRLAATGAGGILETEHPPLSPLLWTTMMTGVSPLQHEILDFTRFNPYTHEKEPITSDERRAPAIWNMLTYGGKSAAVFGLWATYPAEPVHGVNVSDRLFTFLYSDSNRPPGVVYPPLRQPWGEAQVAAAERGVEIGRLRAYLPSIKDEEFTAISKMQNPYAHPAAALRRILIETDIYRRLSLDYLKSRSPLPDLSIVYIQGTDTIGHVFAPFAPPKQPEVSQADYDRYHGVPERYFAEVDALLGEYVALAEREGAVIMIASDHGFRWREGRPTQISSTATATAAKWHRNEGIYLTWGPGIAAKPGHPSRATVRQVCAMLLALTGMPQADYPRHFQRAAPPPAPTSNRATSEELAKLRALGYIGANEATRPASPQNDTKTAGAYNNGGLILRQQGRTDEAIAAFQRALAIDPHYASAMWNLSDTSFNAGKDLDRADALLVSAMQNGLPEPTKYVIARAIAYQRLTRIDRSLKLLDAALAAAPNDGELRLFRGRYRMDRRDCAGALEDFRVAEQVRPNDPVVYASAGLAQMCLGDTAAARESFARSLQLDPNQPMLRRLLP